MNKIGSQILKIVSDTNDKFNIFSKEDKAVFAISGGKDSLSLLTLLQSHFKEIKCLHVRISPTSDISFIEFASNFHKIDIVESDILTEARNSKKNPCFICSRRRNQKIFEYAQSQGIKKVVFAHNREDVIETLLMNMLYSRKISTMMPKQVLFAGKIEVLRPFYEVPEVLLYNYSKDIPSISKSCEFDGNTKRQYIKDLVNQIAKEHPKINIKDNIYNSILALDKDFIPKL